MKLKVNQKKILRKMQKERSDIDDGGTFCLVGVGSYSNGIPRKCGSDAPSAWYWPLINELMAFCGGILGPACVSDCQMKIFKVFWIYFWIVPFFNAVYTVILSSVSFVNNSCTLLLEGNLCLQILCLDNNYSLLLPEMVWTIIILHCCQILCLDNNYSL